MLDLRDVRKHYSSPGGVVKAVDGASLALTEGEFVAVFGPSGSGKTTLLMLAAGLLSPDAGAVSFRGRDLAALARNDLLAFRREHVGFVYQTFNLHPGMSALDNIVLVRLLSGAKRRDAEAEAYELLELVGLSDRAAHRAIKLSGGEQQRVAVARALAGGPSLIVADEPTGNLDTENGNRVLSLLSRLAKEKSASVLLATHDRDALDYADRAQRIRDGRLDGYHDPVERQAAPAGAMAAPEPCPT